MEKINMRKIELVFRTIGERTSEIALDFAIKNINPYKVHIIENVKPFAKAMKKILSIDYEGDYIVFMDADCIIMENLQHFLNNTNLAYIDCFVMDKFRGTIHTGVHITRRDVVEEMKKIDISPNDIKFILRPESRIRNIALENLGEKKTFKKFRIFHDFFQYYRDIFVKYAIRELRSRAKYKKEKLEFCMTNWRNNDLDYVIAKKAVKFSREKIPIGTPAKQMADYIEKLPSLADQQLTKLNIIEKKPLELQEVLDLRIAYNTLPDPNSDKKIFCIGLSRTGTKSLTVALYILGYNIIHYPSDEQTLRDLIEGNYSFSVLQDYDGISDITVSPYFAQLHKLYPNSKFILTVRNKEDWLRSFQKHWGDRPPFDDPNQNETYMKVRRLLRASVYGTYKFNRDRMSYVYDLHKKSVLDYFKNKPHSLLVLNIFKKKAWKKLTKFLNVPKPKSFQEFPNIKSNERLFQIL
jgi:hypothetical protein